MTPLRLAFMGTPDFALPALRALAAAGHEIAAVYAQPPRPAGRGHKQRPCPVHALALARGWPARTPASLKDAGRQAAFADLGLDVAVVVAYGLMLPPAFLAAPRQRGSSEAWTLTQPSRGAASTAGGSIRPEATTTATSRSRAAKAACAPGSLRLAGVCADQPRASARAWTGQGRSLWPRPAARGGWA